MRLFIDTVSCLSILLWIVDLVLAEEKSLYTSEDHVLELDVNTFDKGVYGQKRAFFIEFYSSWCGACISYAPKWKLFAQSVQHWNETVQVAVLNCADEKNSPICREHSIDSFPTIKYFKYGSANKDDGLRFSGDKHSIDTLPLEVAQLVYDDWIKQRPVEWPSSFHQIAKTTNLQDLWDNPSGSVATVMAIITEPMPCRTGWANVINFVGDQRVMVVLVEEDHPLMTQLTHSPPRLVLYRRGQSDPEFLSRESMSWTSIEKVINDSLSSTQHQVQSNVDETSQVRQFEVQLVDLSSAMHYMLSQEIPRKAVIDGDNLSALKTWIHMLSKFAPGRVPMRRLFYRLDDFLNSISTSLTADDWLNRFEIIQSDLGHPLPTNRTWMACQGSKPYLRGYTCGLWTLMHAVTIQADKLSANDASFNAVSDVLEPIHQFVFRFLSCEECANNFDHMTQNNDIKAASKPEDAILWLWRAHNNVNARLENSASSDPAFPKRQFPPSFLCPDCRRSNSEVFDEMAVLKFLRVYYINIKADSPQGSSNYVLSTFEKGKKVEENEERRMNPKFAAIAAERVNELEESERRLRREQMNANPQRRWKDLSDKDAMKDPSSESTRSLTYLWLLAIALVLFLVYSKYRRNRTKFWKTFYYYNDYKLCPWTGNSPTSTKNYTA